MAKRKPLSRDTMANIHEAVVFFDTTPREVRKVFEDFTMTVSDLGDLHQMPPRQMAVMAATLIGCLAMTEAKGDVHDDGSIDAFVVFAQDAVNAMVASVRIAAGWRPAGNH